MTYEKIDIVDENDVIIKTIDRTPEWNKARPDTYRLINIFVTTSEGKLVIQQRSHKKSSGTLKFDTSVGGIVPSGMTYAETAEKEMLEELGIRTPLTFITAFKTYNNETGQLRHHSHLFIATSDGPYSNWEEEAERLEFMTIEELTYITDRYPYLCTPGLLEAVKHYSEHISQ